MKDTSRLSLPLSRMARVGVLILAATASSQAGFESPQSATVPQGATQSPAQTFHASADYVEVDMYITDGQGRCVRGLRKEQFRVLESGQPHDVATLQLVDIPRAIASARAGVTTSPEPRASAGDAAPGSGRLYFLVRDDLHTRPEGFPGVRAIASVKSAVATTPPPPAASAVQSPTPVTPVVAPSVTTAAARAPTGTATAVAPSAANATPATRAAPLSAAIETQPAAARSVDDLVRRARAYVVEYGAELSLVIGVERYRQWVLNSDASTLMGSGGNRPWSRETVSEFALVRVKDDWLGYRDVFNVDGKAVGDRQDRLLQLFQKTPATAVDQGRRIADESARYNAGGMQRNFNVPTMALFFLHPSNASRFSFDLVGSDTIDGTPASKVRYRETQKPTIIRTSTGKNMPVSGVFWIDPSRGRILKTSLEITGEAQLGRLSGSMADAYANKTVRPGEWADGRVDTYSRVSTTYKLDERIGLLLPAEMVEEYQGVSRNQATGEDRITKINCRATYSDFKKFETSGRIVVVK